MKERAFLYAAALAGTVVLPPSLPVAAEEVSAIEEVVVTARRRDENLQDVPIAVTALSGDALAASGASDLSDVAQVVPSVTLEPSRATNSTLTAFIRGVGQQDPLAGFEQGVALYVDDVYLARPQGALLDIYDVARIEILRGPQGTLYGRNAVGGAVKYVTRRLGDESTLRLKGSLGSYGQRDLEATFSTPVSDSFRVGATIASLNRDGFGDNHTTGDDNYNKEILAYRLSAEFEPNDAWSIRLAYDKTDDDSNPVAGYRPFPAALSGDPVLGDFRDTNAGAADAVTTAGIGGANEVVSEGLHLSIEWSISDNWTLRSITASREDDTKSVIDFDSVASLDFDAPVIYDNEQFSQEFQLLFNSDRLNAVTGFYYLDASAANDFDVVLGLLHPLGITAYTGGEVDTNAWSVFADVTYNITGRLSIALGGRYTEDKREADIFRATYLGFGSNIFGNADAIQIAVSSDYESDKTFTDFSPRINVSYQISDDLNAYASYSQGFKAGSFDPRGANFVTPEVARGFDPETLDSLEIGLKSTWWDGRAITNIALFLSDYKDMQIPGSVGVDSDNDGVNDSFVGTVTNAGKAEIDGFELEGTFLLSNKLTAKVALSKLNADIEEWIFNGTDISDQREVQNTPETMAYVGLAYETEVAGGSLQLGLNWTYKDDIVQFETPLPIIDQDSHDIVNANIVWTSDDAKWWVGLHGKNLSDEDVKTAGYCFGSGGCPSTLGLEDNTTIFYGPPRTWTATVSYQL